MISAPQSIRHWSDSDQPASSSSCSRGIEAFHVTILPRAFRQNEDGLGADCFDLSANLLGDKLGSIVAPDEGGRSPKNEEVSQGIDHVGRVQYLAFEVNKISNFVQRCAQPYGPLSGELLSSRSAAERPSLTESGRNGLPPPSPFSFHTNGRIRWRQALMEILATILFCLLFRSWRS